MSTKLQGQALFGLTLVLYAYFTAWVLLTPFIEEGQPILRLFPLPSRYALAPIVLAGVLLWGVTLTTLGCFLVSAELAKFRQQRAAPRTKHD